MNTSRSISLSRAYDRSEARLKGVLTRGKLVSGVGNAYADEILHDAMLYPFKKVTRFSEDEKRSLHRAVYSVPESAVEVLRKRVGDQIHRKIRDFLKIHGKKNEKCPRCGSNTIVITAKKRDELLQNLPIRLTFRQIMKLVLTKCILHNIAVLEL